MSAFYDQASLVVVTSGYKSGKIYAQKPLTTDGQLTFTRASTATRVNASGLIETVASGVPRLDYLGSSCPKILLEPQRANLALQSEAFDTASWFKNNTTITANAGVAPNGTTTSDKIVPTTTGTSRWAEQSRAITTSTPYTNSCFVKADGFSWVAIHHIDGDIGAWFNVSSGTIGTINAGCTALITSFGNGWYRCSVAKTSAGTTGYSAMQLVDANNSLTATASGTNGLLIWGAQIEAGAYPTSYIPTTSAAVTRLADAASKTGISSLIGQTEGTLFVEAEYTRISDDGIARKLASLNDGSSANLVDIYVPSGLNTLQARVRAGSTTLGAITTSSVPTGKVKIAYAYKANNYALYINGTQIGVVTTGGALSFSSPVTIAQIGDGEAGNDELGGTIGQTLVFKTRLTNAQLAELTTL
jgi:hypothetical protein